MQRGVRYLAIFLVVSSLVPAATYGGGISPVEKRLIHLQAQLEAQQEARNRQANAFDAAATRIEFVNGALVAVIAIAGIGAGLLALRGVRTLAREQIATQMDSAIRARGEEIFATESKALREEYEEKFATQFDRYKRLTDND